MVTSTIEEWYKINVAIPFLDHIITDLQVRFSAYGKTASSLCCLVPSVILKCESIDFSDLIEFYHSYLPCPELFEQEFVL